MALNIRDPEVHRLARDVATATGETITEAVKQALRERLTKISTVSAAERERRLAAIEDVVRRFQSLPELDPRTPDEILDYDENGLPR